MIQPKSPDAPVDAIRQASRLLVRELGFLGEGLGGTRLPPSAVHALLEIDAGSALSASALAERLNLEKSSVSRLLRKLVEAGEILETPDALDGRAKLLALTTQGQALVAGIHGFAQRQVAAAMGQLTPAQQGIVAEGLRLYAGALAADRAVTDRAAIAPAITADTAPAITIEAGYRSGALARCIDLHARYYARRAGFGRAFEALVAAGLADFAGRLDRPCNGLWLALRQEEILGTVAIDGEDLGGGIAHLRWFIVDDGARGGGAGRRLLSAALDFCDRQGFPEVHLWTFQGLDAARHLYESQGFRLAEERPGRQWGTAVLEQRFVRRHAPAA